MGRHLSLLGVALVVLLCGAGLVVIFMDIGGVFAVDGTTTFARLQVMEGPPTYDNNTQTTERTYAVIISQVGSVAGALRYILDFDSALTTVPREQSAHSQTYESRTRADYFYMPYTIARLSSLQIGPNAAAYVAPDFSDAPSATQQLGLSSTAALWQTFSEFTFAATRDSTGMMLFLGSGADWSLGYDRLASTRIRAPCLPEFCYVAGVMQFQRVTRSVRVRLKPGTARLGLSQNLYDIFWYARTVAWRETSDPWLLELQAMDGGPQRLRLVLGTATTLIGGYATDSVYLCALCDSDSVELGTAFADLTIRFDMREGFMELWPGVLLNRWTVWFTVVGWTFFACALIENRVNFQFRYSDRGGVFARCCRINFMDLACSLASACFVMVAYTHFDLDVRLQMLLDAPAWVAIAFAAGCMISSVLLFILVLVEIAYQRGEHATTHHLLLQGAYESSLLLAFHVCHLDAPLNVFYRLVMFATASYGLCNRARDAIQIWRLEQKQAHHYVSLAGISGLGLLSMIASVLLGVWPIVWSALRMYGPTVAILSTVLWIVTIPNWAWPTAKDAHDTNKGSPPPLSMVAPEPDQFENWHHTEHMRGVARMP
jgi:hypothetical protein